jgi:hypothetical protein
MKRTSLVVAGFSAIVALGLIGYGCTSGDTVNDGTGGKGSGGQTGSGTGGSTTSGTGGSSSGTGGMTTSGTGGSTTGTGGSTTGTGGSTTGTGGMTTTGTGGATGGLLMCASTLKDKAACTSTDVSCTKNCGVNAGASQPRATKPCACIASTVTPPMAWDCTNAGPCTYPATFDKTCFSLTPAPAACPTTLITTNVTTCTNTAGATCGPICGSAVTTVNSYQDSSMNPKVGYCACINGVWQCASTKEWPM